MCLSVREDISGTIRAIFTKSFVHVAYVRGSVLLRHVDDRPHHLSARSGRRECTAQAKRNLRLTYVSVAIELQRFGVAVTTLGVSTKFGLLHIGPGYYWDWMTCANHLSM